MAFGDRPSLIHPYEKEWHTFVSCALKGRKPVGDLFHTCPKLPGQLFKIMPKQMRAFQKWHIGH